jgi:hypothetical protein
VSIKSTLLGELVTRAVDPVSRTKPRPLFRVVAVWQGPSDPFPVATLRPCDFFGRDAAGPLVNSSVSSLVMP